MRMPKALGVLAAAVLAAACGEEACPTTAAYAEDQDMSGACAFPAPQQVTIAVQLCEACSHTAPSCEADLGGVASGEIFLDTRWEICADDSSCSAQACSSVTCQFAVPDGVYTVHTLDQASGTAAFELVVGGAPSCSGVI